MWPWEHGEDVTVEWSNPNKGDQWAVVHWTVDGHHQQMAFHVGSPAITNGTLDKLPLALGSYPVLG